MKATDKNLEAFACDGLRTLILVEKKLDNAAYEEWAERYKVDI